MSHAKPTDDDIENWCGNLQIALQALRANGPNDRDYENALDELGVLSRMVDDLMWEDEA